MGRLGTEEIVMDDVEKFLFMIREEGNYQPSSKRRSSSADEHLINYPDQYKYAVAIDYNMDNPVRDDCSAIFLHVSNGTPTLSCVSIPE
ncbi:hypothetical protein [Salipaludibacillus sp. CF4.18]|uniref:hypothetical protein n=1 Tax=Salipaludibacillus sp. CF4.18 TaxID=3373081 RepID=UPI003EE4E2BD